MQRYILRRLILSVFAIWVTMTLVFIMLRAIPGDPITALAGPEGDVETIEKVKHTLGLDKPVVVQYFYYVRSLLTLDLGDGIYNKQPVLDQIRTSGPRTLSLALLAFLLAVAVGLPAGIVSAVRRYSFWDHLSTLAAFIGLAMPSFWLGIILIILFVGKLHWFPAFGYVGPTESVASWLHHLVLPAIAAGAGFSAVLARQTRSAMLEVLSQDYIRTAYAKGLRERAVIMRHAFKNGLIPVVTVMGIALALLFTGAVITENVFAMKGLGRLLIDSILARDYPVVQGMILVVATVFILSNLVVDVVYAFINPRIRFE